MFAIGRRWPPAALHHDFGRIAANQVYEEEDEEDDDVDEAEDEDAVPHRHLGAEAGEAHFGQSEDDDEQKRQGDIDTGSGIKTGHIQSGAITTDKLANGAVSDAKLGDNAVITSKIFDLAITTSKLADSAVTNIKLADGAVTDTKITGPISGDKLGAHAHNGSDIVDGTITTSKIADGAIIDAKIAGPISESKLPAGVFQKKYANVVVVAKSGGDFSDPIAAMQSIIDASATNPYLIKIMPGIYNMSRSLEVKNYVDVEGSGELVTKLTYSGSSPWSVITVTRNAITEVKHISLDSAINGTTGIINYGNATVSNTTIRVSGAIGQYNYGIYNDTNSTIVLREVKVSASYIGSESVSLFGIYNEGGTLDMNDSLITLTRDVANYYTSSGIENRAGNSAVKNSKVDIAIPGGVNIGVNSYCNIGYGACANKLEIINSQIFSSYLAVAFSGNTNSHLNAKIISSKLSGNSYATTSMYSTILLANTEIVGQIDNAYDGVTKCIGAYNNNFDLLTCP